MTAVITWAGRVLAAAFILSGAAWIANAARESWQRAGRVIEDGRRDVQAGRIGQSVAALDHSDVLAITCDPCNGKPGRCTCPAKCSHPLCGAADTGISDESFSRELRQLLDSDGGGR